MFQHAFEKLEKPQVKSILDKVSDNLSGVSFEAETTTILAMQLDFYPGYKLLEITNNEILPATKRAVVYSDNAHVVLDFTNKPIYDLNASIPIHLDKTNVLDYVRFFFTYVKGKQGRFLITESIEDMNWREEPPPAAKKALSQMLKSISFKKKQEPGKYNLEATMIFKDSLFSSDITVNEDGRVLLSNEELLVEDIPVMDDVVSL